MRGAAGNRGNASRSPRRGGWEARPRGPARRHLLSSRRLRRGPERDGVREGRDEWSEGLEDGGDLQPQGGFREDDDRGQPRGRARGGRATGARGGLLSLTVRNKDTHDRAVRSAKEHWHDRTWSRRVASAIFNFYDDVEKRWRVGTIVSDPSSPFLRLVRERLDDGVNVELPAVRIGEHKGGHDLVPIPILNELILAPGVF